MGKLLLVQRLCFGNAVLDQVRGRGFGLNPVEVLDACTNVLVDIVVGSVVGDGREDG